MSPSTETLEGFQSFVHVDSTDPAGHFMRTAYVMRLHTCINCKPCLMKERERERGRERKQGGEREGGRGRERGIKSERNKGMREEGEMKIKCK